MTTTHASGFGTLLKHYRRAAGLTQEALAERAGLSARGVQDLERGVSRLPRQDTVDLLAAALGLSGEDHAALAAVVRSPAAPASSPPAPLVAPVRAAAHPTGALLPLVGRGRELAVLGRFLASGGEGEPSFLSASVEAPVLLLAGEPGIGKTRLLQATAQQASAGGWRVLAGGCHRRGGQESYAPLLDALARHLHALPPERLRAELEGCAWLARLPPEQERRLMFAAVARLLANVAGPAGVLLVLDDLQWVGPDVLDLLAALVHSSSPAPAHREGGGVPRAGGAGAGRVRVMGAYRDTEVGPAAPLGLLVADLAQAGLAHQHALGPLAREEVAALLDDLLAGVAGGNRAVAARVLERAGGAPFFLVSYAQALRAGGRRRRRGTWRRGCGSAWRCCPRPGGRCWGRRRWWAGACRALLAAAAGQPEGAVLAGLEAACRARLLLEDGEDGYQFAHDVVWEVVEADLGAARRAVLHGRVAAALEADPARASPEALAYHYARGDDSAKAVVYLERAGDDARGRYAHTAARDYYQEAVRRLDAPGRAADAARARRKLGEVLHDLDLPDEALAAFGAALALYERQGDHAGQAEVHQAIAAVHEGRYDFVAAAPHLETALALWPAGREDAALARLLLQVARAKTLAGDGSGRDTAERGAALAERLGEGDLRGAGSLRAGADACPRRCDPVGGRRAV